MTDTRDFEQHPSWSADGEKVLFTRGDVMTNIDIYTMDADGSNQTRLTFKNSNDSHPSWSPDGQFIAFSSFYDGNTDIYTMNSDDSNQTRVTSNSSSENYPASSP